MNISNIRRSFGSKLFESVTVTVSGIDSSEDWYNWIYIYDNTSNNSNNYLGYGSVNREKPSFTVDIPYGIEYRVVPFERTGYTKPNNKVYTAEQKSRAIDIIYSISPVNVSSYNSSPGDIVLYDLVKGKLIIAASNYLSSKRYPSSKYTPVGIVLIPGKHGRYSNNQCGVMSLKVMNCTSDGIGGYISNSSYRMPWGSAISAGSSSDMCTQFPYVGEIDSSGNWVSGEDNTNFPPNIFGNTSGRAKMATKGWSSSTSVTCPHSIGHCYYKGSVAGRLLPSPYYYYTYEKNSAYISTSLGTNPFSQFGRSYHDKIISKRGSKNYSSWSPSMTSASTYPAASSCDMYYTTGTSQGDWYLPTAGELGYLSASIDEVKSSMDRIEFTFGLSISDNGIIHVSSALYNCWSSTEENSGYAWVVGGHSSETFSKNGNKALVIAWTTVHNSDSDNIY